MKVGDKKILLVRSLKEKGLVVQVLKDKIGDEIRYLVTLATKEGLKQFAREDSATLYVYKGHVTGSVFRPEYFGGRAVKDFGKGKGVENFMKEVKTRFDVDFPDYREVIRYAEKGNG